MNSFSKNSYLGVENKFGMKAAYGLVSSLLRYTFMAMVESIMYRENIIYYVSD